VPAIQIQLPKPSLERLPHYYRILKKASEDGKTYLSSAEMGQKAGVPGAQVRKDLLPFKAKGRPSLGFHVTTLKAILEAYLGLLEDREAVLVGAGNLGKALALFPGFHQYRIRIAHLFDWDRAKTGSRVGDYTIHHTDELSAFIQDKKIRIAIITTPAEAAQSVAEELIRSGIVAIWNFSPIRLQVPDSVYVKYEDLSAGLAILSHKAAELGEKGRE
jgi:redox-sensing transcriptional repressor